MKLALTVPQATALHELRLAQPSIEFVLIGAAALSAHVPLARATADVDLVLVAPVSTFTPILEHLGWRRHRRLAHRWHCGDNAYADVLPASPDVLRSGVIRFDDDTEMNASGLELALRHRYPHPIPGFDLDVDVASLGSLVLLKMVAWLDRPHERGKDLEDLARVLDDALRDDDERRWDSGHPVGSRDLAHDEHSAFFAGWELGRIAEATHQALLNRFLSALRDDESAAFGRMLRASRGSDAERLRRQLNAFEVALGTR